MRVLATHEGRHAEARVRSMVAGRARKTADPHIDKMPPWNRGSNYPEIVRERHAVLAWNSVYLTVTLDGDIELHRLMRPIEMPNTIGNVSTPLDIKMR